MKRMAVLGAGSWGTTLAQVLALQGHGVSLWARNAELAGAMASGRENAAYLPGVRLSGNLLPTSSLEEALDGARMVVSAIPSHGLRAVFAEAAPLVAPGAVVVSATKGIEEGTLLLASGVLKEELAHRPGVELVVLSGPSFAREVSRGLPTAVCAGSASEDAAVAVQRAFSTDYFRVYTNTDVTGVELGGALKNVIAIASGISDGLGLGNNARAALITRGLAEISRLGVSMGARTATFSGLSGLGDLVLTCTGALSRNYTVGLEVGKGRSVEDVTGSMRMVAEGVRTSRAACELARKEGVEMPITGEICNVLYGGRAPKEAVLELMTRELKGE
ncbi:MAG: NAD(P)H-dependent glycerol-3-phosphate dehydrogenase [Thermodesulfobacteriota bacterium]